MFVHFLYSSEEGGAEEASMFLIKTCNAFSAQNKNKNKNINSLKHMNKKVMRKASFLTLFAFANMMFATAATPQAEAAKFLDGTWVQNSANGATTISFTTGEALGVNDTIIFTFPDEATVDATGTDANITGYTSPSRTNDSTDNSIVLTLTQAIPATTAIEVVMSDALSAYTATTYAQQSVAININDLNKYPHDFGLAVITNDNTTDVTATVPLFLTLAVDDVTMDLGTLSVASVKDVTQTYTVHSNNRTGIQLQVESDGDLRDGNGNTIDPVTDNAVTSGSEEYGISLSSFTSSLGIEASSVFVDGDDALPTTKTDIVDSSTTVNNGTFDVTYKAAISGDTVAGEYSQVVTFTIATNA